MSDLPLPGLVPDDPENLLSYEARQRISRALIEAERIRTEALSAIETRYRAEPPGSVDFGEYLATGSPFIELTESRMLAARTVLRAEEQEYRKLKLPDPQYRQIMREKIAATVYSLELSALQSKTLDLEFIWTHPQIEDEPRPVECSEKKLAAKDRVKAFIEKKRLDKLAFAKMTGTSLRTVGSVLAGVRVGKQTQIAIAKALETTPEELFSTEGPFPN